MTATAAHIDRSASYALIGVSDSAYLTLATVAPVYPECLYTKAHKWCVDWCVVDGDDRYPQRRVFRTEAEAVAFVG